MRMFDDNVGRFIAFWELQNYERMAKGLPEISYIEAHIAYQRLLWWEFVDAFNADWPHLHGVVK